MDRSEETTGLYRIRMPDAVNIFEDDAMNQIKFILQVASNMSKCEVQKVY